MGLAAGKLNRRLTLLRATKTKNAFNEEVESFAVLAEVRASKRDVSDAERQRAAETGATITARFQTRWNSVTKTLDPTDRVRCEGREYDVTAVKEIGFREGVEISGTARSERV